MAACPATAAFRGICAVLALLLASIAIGASDHRGVFTVDGGAKVLQAERLLDSGFRRFDLDYPGRRFDPDGRHFPVPPPYAVAHGDRFVSQYPVAFPALAAPFAAALGPAGLRVPAALGLAACAGLFAAWLLPAVGRRWALAGGSPSPRRAHSRSTASPFWEHAPSVALALAAQRLAARAAPTPLVGAGALVGVACWLREELFLFGLALAAALLVSGRRPRDVVWLALGAMPAAAAVFAFNLHHVGHPLGPHVLGNVGASLTPPLGDALRDLGAMVAGYGSNLAEARLARRHGGRVLGRRRTRGGARRVTGAPLVALTAVAIAAWGVAALRLHESMHPILTLAQGNGFLLRMPAAALAGAGAALFFRRQALAPLRFGVLAGGLFLLFAWCSAHSFTDFLAGLHWAPRMLLPAAPHSRRRRSRRSTRRGDSRDRAGRAVALAATGPSRSPDWPRAPRRWRCSRTSSATAPTWRTAVLALPDAVVVTDHVALGQQLPRVWSEKTWLLASRPRDLAPLGRVPWPRGRRRLLAAAPRVRARERPGGAGLSLRAGGAAAVAARPGGLSISS